MTEMRTPYDEAEKEWRLATWDALVLALRRIATFGGSSTEGPNGALSTDSPSVYQRETAREALAGLIARKAPEWLRDGTKEAHDAG